MTPEFISAGMVPPHHVTLWSRPALESVAPHYGLTVAEYFLEPLSFADFHWMMQRRRTLCGTRPSSLKEKVVDRSANFLDRILTCYAYSSGLPGVSHGILLRKPPQP